MSGSPISASATSRRRRWPPDSSAGERAGLVGQPDQGDGVVDLAGRAVVAGIELQALPHGQAGLGLGFLQDDPDPVPPGAAGVAGSTPRTLTSPSVRWPEAFEDLDGRGLAGAVGAEEGEDLAAVHFQVDAADRLDGGRSA